MENQDVIDKALPEFPIRGPFGGIQSQLPLNQIESLGFEDLLNIILRNGTATCRPGFTVLQQLPGQIQGVADFFDKNSVRHQVVMTATGLWVWNGGTSSFIQLTSTPALSGSTQLFSWSVLNYQLLFSQGQDVVQGWDGIAAASTPISMNAVAGKFLLELDNHLIVANTLESGQNFAQRYHWTGAGDPTDWTSFNAGVADLLNSLGPINGLTRVYGQGYFLQRFGVTRLIPTGIGTNPFATQPFSSRGKGCICPYSVGVFGEEAAFYVGEADVYQLNGSELVPIGAAPIGDGRRTQGARNAIYAELATQDLNTVFGFVTSNINGNDYNAYWLIIPNGSVWQYNIDEQNWSRWIYGKQPTCAGNFFTQRFIRIKDLIGTIAQQNWTPASLVPFGQLDAALVGFNEGSCGLVDFTNFSEQGFTIASGQMEMGKLRFRKMIQRFRLAFQDIGQATVTLTIANELGYSQSFLVTIGNATPTNQVLTYTVAITKVTGQFLKYTITGGAGAPVRFLEFAPIFEVEGEYKDAINSSSTRVAA